MCHQTFQRPGKSFETSLSEDSGLMEIFTTANKNKKKLVSFPFSRGLNCLYLFKITKTATSQNFQWLKEKYLPLLRQKIHKRTSGFGIFTSKRTILLASGIGPPSNFEDC